jgi:phage terminase small subunit
MKLTEKQKAWVDYYKQGHTATEAARLAGYKARSNNSFQSIGAENLRKLADFVKDRDTVLETPRIADMEEINAFWTETMRDESADRRDRLKASELRAKCLGAFLERKEVTIQPTNWYIGGEEDGDEGAQT